MRRHLVIMAREPRLGVVKKRLAADIGRVGAWAFYDQSLKLTLRHLQSRRWKCWLAATPDGANIRHDGWCQRKQGSGDLGQRMFQPMKTLPPGPVVVVGSDAPDIGPRHIERAFRALGNHDWVFGPAVDGGYWLVGARRWPRLINPFKGVRWSSEHALDDTLANVMNDPRRVRVALIDILSDVDTGADYQVWKKTKPTFR